MSNLFASLLPPAPTGDHLEIRGGPEDGRCLPLAVPELWLGSSEAATVPLLLDARIEPLHCRLTCAGQVFAEDGSTGGTYVNDRRIVERTELADGDRLRIGATTMVVRRALVLAPPSAARTLGEER